MTFFLLFCNRKCHLKTQDYEVTQQINDFVLQNKQDLKDLYLMIRMLNLKNTSRNVSVISNRK